MRDVRRLGRTSIAVNTGSPLHVDRLMAQVALEILEALEER
jgi:hypothetical protein